MVYIPTLRVSERLPEIEEAHCTGQMNLFFSEIPDELSEAKEICGGCPSREPCLSYALTSDVQGVWGGTDDADRAFLRAQAKGEPLQCRKGHIYEREDYKPLVGKIRCRVCDRAQAAKARKETKEMARERRHREQREAANLEMVEKFVAKPRSSQADHCPHGEFTSYCKPCTETRRDRYRQSQRGRDMMARRAERKAVQNAEAREKRIADAKAADNGHPELVERTCQTCRPCSRHKIENRSYGTCATQPYKRSKDNL